MFETTQEVATFTMDKAHAGWLHKALNFDSPQRHVRSIQIWHTARYGSVATATDGHRLHVVTVSSEIPAGWYLLNGETGLLTATPDNGSPVAWEQVVPTDAKLTVTGVMPRKESIFHIGGTRVAIINGANLTAVNQQFLKDAVSGNKVYRILAQESPRHPVKIDMSHTNEGAPDHVQFAVLMPLHPDMVAQGKAEAHAPAQDETWSGMMGRPCTLHYKKTGNERNWKKASLSVIALSQDHINQALQLSQQDGWKYIKFIQE